MDSEQGSPPPEEVDPDAPVSLDEFRKKKLAEMGPRSERPTYAELRRRVQLSGTEISPKSRWFKDNSGSNRWWHKIPEAVRKILRRG